jgi:hypothetical protein
MVMWLLVVGCWLLVVGCQTQTRPKRVTPTMPALTTIPIQAFLREQVLYGRNLRRLCDITDREVSRLIKKYRFMQRRKNFI